MNDSVSSLLRLAEGPVFRAAFALLVLGLLRAAILTGSDLVAAWLTIRDKRIFWRKLRMRLTWFVFPTLVNWRTRYAGRHGLFAYHMGLCCASLVFRAGVILVPAFMAAHVYLWERGLGLAWPTLPGALANGIAVAAILAGAALFLGRMYSPLLRQVEPGWTFFKPLILLAPLLTGFLAMHPMWSPLDYSVVRLVHVLCACVVFVMVPFGRLLTCVHARITDIVPEAAWGPSRQPSAISHQPFAAGTQVADVGLPARAVSRTAEARGRAVET